jgi:hypothetical protein
MKDALSFRGGIKTSSASAVGLKYVEFPRWFKDPLKLWSGLKILLSLWRIKDILRHGRYLELLVWIKDTSSMKELPTWIEDTSKRGRYLELPGWLTTLKLKVVRVERNDCSLTNMGMKRFQCT